MSKLRALIYSLLAITLIFTLTGCGGKPSTPPAAAGPRPQVSVPKPTAPVEIQKGVSLSPKSFQADDFKAFFAETSKSELLVSWAGDWAELEMAGSAPYVVADTTMTSSSSYKVPVIELQVFSQASGKLLRPLNEATQKRYINSAVAFVKKYPDVYLGIGIEVNILSEKSPADFETFIQLFNKTYDAVKSVSPETQVFTIFQLERMKGLNGGLFGGVNDTKLNQWSLLGRLVRADLFAFTTYPGLVFKTPADIPDDYYEEIALYTDRPVIFTEIGWQSASVSAEWQSSEAMQAEFIELFFSYIASLEPEMAIWSFMYDPPAEKPFDSMGLFRADGMPRPGWQIWLDSGK